MFKLTSAAVLALLGSAAASPATVARAPIQKRSVPSAPFFVTYSDDWVTGALPAVADVDGFNVFALAFLWDGSAQDQASNWASLTAAEQQTAIALYHAAGIYVIVSAFGSVPTPTSSGEDAATVGAWMASWVQSENLDGIDLDYEDLDCFDTATCNPEAWIETFTTTIRQTLPVGQYILSHAPLAPWFSPTYGWANGGYLAIDQSVGDLVDWYNVQFYNQGTTEYTTCAGLLTASSSTWPETALFQISANGVDVNKIVVGKPATAADASNGFVDTTTLAGCLQQANSQGWNAGVMSWQYPDANSAWITSVRALVWPVGGGTPPPITSTSTSTSSGSTGTGGSGGSCSGVSAWSASDAYPAGSQVSYNGDLWTATQWNEDEAPGSGAGAWTDNGACGSVQTGSSIGISTKTGSFPPKGTYAYTAVAALPVPTGGIQQ